MLACPVHAGLPCPCWPRVPCAAVVHGRPAQQRLRLLLLLPLPLLLLRRPDAATATAATLTAAAGAAVAAAAAVRAGAVARAVVRYAAVQRKPLVVLHSWPIKSAIGTGARAAMVRRGHNRMRRCHGGTKTATRMCHNGCPAVAAAAAAARARAAPLCRRQGERV
eukprot:366199-Chlamydomonas_euryale.AAC.20